MAASSSKRELGRRGLTVAPIGYGCLSLTDYYGGGFVSDREAVRTIQRALELGVTLFDTSDMYGGGDNERILGKALKGRRDGASIATKFGSILGPRGEIVGICGRPEFVRARCEDSLRRLGVETIDLYQQQRIDPGTPVEETVGAAQELVQEGKVRFLGLGEARAADVRRAAVAAPISTLQSEYSLFERFLEREEYAACAEHGIGVLAYAPLGRGLLTGRFRSTADFGEGDRRGLGLYPRLEEENLRRNLKLVAAVEAVAATRGATSAQIALAWLLARGGSVVPIPGTRNVGHLEENVSAAHFELSPAELDALDALVPPGGSAAGERYSETFMPTWVSPPLAASAPGSHASREPRAGQPRT